MKIQIVAHPSARQKKVEKDLFGTLHVYVNEPPLEGKANQAILEALAVHFKVKKAQIKLVSGNKSKNKVFEIV